MCQQKWQIASQESAMVWTAGSSLATTKRKVWHKAISTVFPNGLAGCTFQAKG